MPRNFKTKPPLNPDSYKLQEYVKSVRLNLLELHGSGQHQKLQQAVQQVIPNYVLEAVGWVRANSVAACTKPSVSKKRKSDELLILPEMNEEQRQQLLKVHEERQRKLELQRLTQIEESRHKMKRNIRIG